MEEARLFNANWTLLLFRWLFYWLFRRFFCCPLRIRVNLSSEGCRDLRGERVSSSGNRAQLYDMDQRLPRRRNLSKQDYSVICVRTLALCLCDLFLGEVCLIWNDSLSEWVLPGISRMHSLLCIEARSLRTCSKKTFADSFDSMEFSLQLSSCKILVLEYKVETLLLQPINSIRLKLINSSAPFSWGKRPSSSIRTSHWTSL